MSEVIFGGTCSPILLDTQIPSTVTKELQNKLLEWYDLHHRNLPWRDRTDLYAIWLSEVMLQQTRVDQVWTYYERFLTAFPTLEVLAEADLDDVLRVWEGLGYYARARNLHAAARKVVASGHLPTNCSELRSLPGIGPYTSRAIASIAFGEAVAAVDGNVRRVLSRLFAHPGSPAKSVQQLADTLLCRPRPGDHNQAMMELGSQVCTPKNPQCTVCPLQNHCLSWSEGTPESYPVPKKKNPIPHHDVAAGILRNSTGQILIQQRAPKGLLGGLWELPGGKAKHGESGPETCARELHEELGVEVIVGNMVGKVEHAYSHFRITLRVYECTIANGQPVSTGGLTTAWVKPDALHRFAFPKANRRILNLLTAPSTETS